MTDAEAIRAKLAELVKDEDPDFRSEWLGPVCTALELAVEALDALDETDADMALADIRKELER